MAGFDGRARRRERRLCRRVPPLPLWLALMTASEPLPIFRHRTSNVSF